MSKYKSISFALIVLSLGLPFLYQNCAPVPEAQLDLSSSGIQTLPLGHYPEDHGTEVPTEPEPALKMSTMQMDRIMLYQMFIDIFGENVKSLAPVISLKKEKSIFGSPCTIYDNYRSARANFGVDAEADTCPNSNASTSLSAPIYPTGNVVHQAIIYNICQAAINNSATLAYALNQIKDSASQSVPTNTTENVIEMIGLFYRNKPAPDAELINSLSVQVGNPARLAGWKSALSATCISSHWQAL